MSPEKCQPFCLGLNVLRSYCNRSICNNKHNHMKSIYAGTTVTRRQSFCESYVITSSHTTFAFVSGNHVVSTWWPSAGRMSTAAVNKIHRAVEWHWPPLTSGHCLPTNAWDAHKMAHSAPGAWSIRKHWLPGVVKNMWFSCIKITKMHFKHAMRVFAARHQPYVVNGLTRWNALHTSVNFTVKPQNIFCLLHKYWCKIRTCFVMASVKLYNFNGNFYGQIIICF